MTMNGEAMSFVAVNRSQCRLEVSYDGEKEADSSSSTHRYCFPSSVVPEGPFVWAETSDLARRSRCNRCGSALCMDMEWFEPETIWLANPTVLKNESGNRQNVSLEDWFPDGLVDADVCWSSRLLPKLEDPFGTSRADFGDLFSDGTKEASTLQSPSGRYPPPRGREQWVDLDWSGFVLDSGKAM